MAIKCKYIQKIKRLSTRFSIRYETQPNGKMDKIENVVCYVLVCGCWHLYNRNVSEWVIYVCVCVWCECVCSIDY